MKLYHGRWDDSPKEFIGEATTTGEMNNLIHSYVPSHFKIGYRRWIDERKEYDQFVVDYGSHYDFIFIRDLSDSDVRGLFGE